MASSARSKEPARRMSVAMILPDSRRKTASTAPRTSSLRTSSLRTSSIPQARTALAHARSLRRRGQLLDLPDLDTAGRAATSRGQLRGPGNRFVNVLAIEDVIARQLFFRLGEGAIHHDGLAILLANSPCRVGGEQGIDTLKDALRPRCFHDSPMAVHLLFDRFLREISPFVF